MATSARPEGQRAFTILRLSGDLGFTPIDKLSAALEAATDRQFLLLDLREVTYLTSAHISLILSVHKRLDSQHGALAVVVADANVVRIFAIAGLSRVMNVFSDLEDAEAFLVSPAISRATPRHQAR